MEAWIVKRSHQFLGCLVVNHISFVPFQKAYPSRMTIFGFFMLVDQMCGIAFGNGNLKVRVYEFVSISCSSA